MPVYTVQDKETGLTLKLEGDSPPTEQELASIFEKQSSSLDKSADAVKLEDGSWTEDPAVAGRMVLDGLLFGWGTEALAGIGATVAASKGEDYNKSYDQLFKTMVAEEQEYREDYPAASLTLNLAGGIGTGFVGVGRALATKGAAAATKGLQSIGMGARTAKGVQALGASAGIGAVSGAGAADTGDRLEGAKEGAKFGLGSSIALKTGGFGWNQLAKQRISTALGKGDDFKPITLAADYDKEGEAFLGRAYRDLVGAAYGGETLIMSQQNKYLKPLNSAINNTDKALRNKKAVAQDAIEKVKTDFTQTKQVRQDNYNSLKESIEDKLSQGKEIVNEDFLNKKVLIQAKNADVATKELEETFRQTAITKSMPFESTNEDIVEVLSAPTVNEALNTIDGLWKSKSYKMVTDRKFRVSPSKLTDDLNKILKDNPSVRIDTDKIKEAENVVGFVSDKMSKGNWISGKDLMTVRNQIAKAASKEQDQTRQTIFTQIKDSLDDIVEVQLKGKALTNFKEESKNYAHVVVLRDAVTSASDTANRGAFTADQWVKSIGKNNKTLLRRGKGVLRGEAEDVANKIKQAEEGVASSIKDAVEDATKLKSNQMKRLGLEKTARLRKAKKDNLELARKQQKSMEDQKTIAANRGQIEELTNDLKRNQEELSRMESVSARPSSIFAQLAATGFLGTLVGGDFSAEGILSNATQGVLVGALGARGLASQAGQRAVAGQTSTQNAMRALSARLGSGLNVSTPAVSGMLAGQQEVQ
jgi:hypothetical protein